MHHLSLLSIYTYLKLSIIIHLFLSIYLSIDRSYPIPSYPVLPILPILSILSILLGSSEKKNSHPPTGCHITPDPPAPPWSMLIAPSEPKSLFFEGLSKQSAVTTLNWGKGGTQVSSQWDWQDGCFFWRTRYLSYLAYLSYVSYLSDLSFLFYLTYLSYLSLSLYRSICLPIYIFMDYLFCILTVYI